MFDDSFEVLTFPTVTDRGRPIPNYAGTPTSVSVSGVDVQPGGSTELLAEHRIGNAIRFTIYDPHMTVLSAAAILRVRGEVVQVDGDPEVWPGTLPHQVIRCVAWKQP